MLRKATILAALAALSVAGAAVGGQLRTPVNVSPGGPRTISAIADRCPTFSWAAVPGARSYELVVYPIAEDGGEVRAALTEAIPAPAQTWTPAANRCLERGQRYAWWVRAVSEVGTSEWSQASLFQVVQVPTEAEFLEALAVLERYLAGPRSAAEAAVITESPGPAPATAETSTTPGTSEATPASGTPALTALGDSCCDGNLPAAYAARFANSSTASHPDVLALELTATGRPSTDTNYIGFFDWDAIQSQPRLVGELEAWRLQYPDDSLLRFTGSASISGWTRASGSTETCTSGSICSDWVACPGDVAVLGGGFEILGGDTTGLRVLESSPAFGDWYIQLNNTASGTSFTWRVVAICAETGAG